jgi:hypothetical protein
MRTGVARGTTPLARSGKKLAEYFGKNGGNGNGAFHDVWCARWVRYQQTKLANLSSQKPRMPGISGIKSALLFRICHHQSPSEYDQDGAWEVECGLRVSLSLKTEICLFWRHALIPAMRLWEPANRGRTVGPAVTFAWDKTVTILRTLSCSGKSRKKRAFEI